MIGITAGNGHTHTCLYMGLLTLAYNNMADIATPIQYQMVIAIWQQYNINFKI